MQMLVECWTLAENKHVGASRMLCFHSGCQSDAGLLIYVSIGCWTLAENKHAGANRMLGFIRGASRMLDFNVDASRMLDFTRK